MKAEAWRGTDFYRASSDHNRVLIVGAGHIGSFVAYGLARLGVKDITVVDPDIVEAHNLPHQFFAESLVAKLPKDAKIDKVSLLQKTIEFMVGDCNIKTHVGKIETIWDSLEAVPNVIFSCVDKMATRTWLFNKAEAIGADAFFDARTGGEYARVFSILLNYDSAIEHYRTTLHTDEEGVQLPCTGQAIIDVSMVISGEMVQRYRRFVSKKLSPMETFHDCAIGTSGLMNLYSTNMSSLDRDDTMVHKRFKPAYEEPTGQHTGEDGEEGTETVEFAGIQLESDDVLEDLEDEEEPEFDDEPYDEDRRQDR